MARAVFPALLCLLLALARPAAAQNAVTMIVGYPPGGASDLMARLMQPELSAALGAQVVVKNSPGANGTVGALELARARPDGATLLLAPGGSLVLTPHTRGAPFRQEDFAPVCQVSAALVVMMTQGDSGLRTLPDVVARANYPFDKGEMKSILLRIGSEPHVRRSYQPDLSR